MKHIPLVQSDPLLKPFEKSIIQRFRKGKLKELEITDVKNPLKDCTNNYLYYGLHKTEIGWIFREKAPNAKQIFLFGDFSYWQIKDQFALIETKEDLAELLSKAKNTLYGKECKPICTRPLLSGLKT